MGSRLPKPHLTIVSQPPQLCFHSDSNQRITSINRHQEPLQPRWNVPLSMKGNVARQGWVIITGPCLAGQKAVGRLGLPECSARKTQLEETDTHLSSPDGQTHPSVCRYRSFCKRAPKTNIEGPSNNLKYAHTTLYLSSSQKEEQKSISKILTEDWIECWFSRHLMKSSFDSLPIKSWMLKPSWSWDIGFMNIKIM